MHYNVSYRGVSVKIMILHAVVCFGVINVVHSTYSKW